MAQKNIHIHRKSFQCIGNLSDKGLNCKRNLIVGATHYHAQLRLTYKGCAIKVLVACNSWKLYPLDPLNGLALGCYQPSPEVLWYLPFRVCGKINISIVLSLYPLGRWYMHRILSIRVPQTITHKYSCVIVCTFTSPYYQIRIVCVSY